MNNRSRGFTLIEALVVVSVLAVVTALAAPNLRTFFVRNKIASLSNEFSAALVQTRALAVSKNTCASICASKTVSGTSATATCSNSAGDDFQTGWMIFENPTCTATLTTPAADTDVEVLRAGDSGSGYSIKPSAAALSIVMFDPRGFAVLGAAGSFSVEPPSASDAAYKRTICIDAAGRPTIRKTLASATCS